MVVIDLDQFGRDPVRHTVGLMEAVQQRDARMSAMDARTVYRQWIGNYRNPNAPAPPDRRGRRGRHLQGTSPERYGDDVADWLDFIEDQVPIGAWHAEPSHLKTWLDLRGGAPRSRARRVSAVGAFYAYAVLHKHVLYNPVDRRLSGKAHLTPPGPRLGEGQLHLIRWGADQLEGPRAERDRLLVYLLLAGLRSRQIVEFELPAVIFEQARMVGEIWQKGGGTRPLVFPDEVRAAVKAYLPLRTFKGPHSSAEHGPLLVSNNGLRLDTDTTPRTTLRLALAHARACPDPDAPELPARVTPDMVALSPGPFTLLRELKR